MKKILLVQFLLTLGLSLAAFNQHDINVWSEGMQKDVPVTVITPDSYDASLRYPVVYILHGYSDNPQKWAAGGVVGNLVDQYNVLAVLPDGGFSSWYFDSPVMSEYKYETFISKEPIEYIDNNYSTVQDRKGRAITGNSMGGHGAMYNAIRHQEVYGSVGCLSGGVDIRPFPNDWHISQRLGTQEEYPERWAENTIINMTHLLKPGALNIAIDCGTEDFFFEVNCNLHEKLLAEGIPHEFTTRPGVHNWVYWMNAIKYQFLFFSDRF